MPIIEDAYKREQSKLINKLFLLTITFLAPSLCWAQKDSVSVMNDTTYRPHGRKWGYDNSGGIALRVNKHFWLPTGNLSNGGINYGGLFLFGIESYEVGAIYMGFAYRANRYTKQPFYYWHEGILVEQNEYESNGDIIFSYEHHLIKKKRWVFYPSLSAGWTIINFKDVQETSRTSFNIGIGGGVKYFALGGVPAYIQVQYHYLDFKNTSGSSFAGDAISINSGFSLFISH